MRAARQREHLRRQPDEAFGLRLGDPFKHASFVGRLAEDALPLGSECADEQIAYASGALSGKQHEGPPSRTDECGHSDSEYIDRLVEVVPGEEKPLPLAGAPRGAQRDDPRDLVLGGGVELFRCGGEVAGQSGRKAREVVERRRESVRKRGETLSVERALRADELHRLAKALQLVALEAFPAEGLPRHSRDPFVEKRSHASFL